MDGRPSHKSATPTVFSKETNPGRSASNMGTSDEPSQRIPSPTDPTAGLILIQGHYIIHLAMFIAIFFVQKPPKILNCLMNNELASQITLQILKKASQYEKERINKYKKENPYEVSVPTKKSDLPK